MTAFLRDIDTWFIQEVLPHGARYRALARRLSPSSEEAADLVQDVYLKVLATDGWRAIKDPRAYVLRMVKNLAIQKMRRARVLSIDAVANMEAITVSDDRPDAFEQASSRQRLRLVLDALQTLPPRCREVVELRRIQGLSARDIAARLGLSLSTVEKRLARGMAAITLAMESAEAVGQPRRREPRARKSEES